MRKKRTCLLNFLVILSLVLAISFSMSLEAKAASPFEKEVAVSTITTTKSASFDLNKTDTSKAQHTVSFYIYLFGGTIVAFAMGLAAIRMILVRNSESKREEAMTTFGKIIVGCSILGSCILLSGFLIGVANHVGSAITNGGSSLANVPSTSITDDDGNFVVKAFANIFISIEKCIFNLFDKYFGFLPLDKLIFNSNANAFGVTGTITVPPFTDSEWSNLNYMYLLVSSICAPLVLIMVAKTGISLIMSANRPAQRSGLQEDVCRWLFSLTLIAVGPLLLKGLFLLSSDMTNAVVKIFNASLGKDNYVTDISMVDSIKTGSALTSAIVKCLFAWKFFQINMLFLVRKIILTAMYAFTPLAALFWGIDNRTQAIQIWFGEVITNATMQFFYAFTFSVMIISLSGSSWKNWFYAIVWIFALVKLAEVFRNSLQGLFTKLAGVDEMAIAGRSFGPVSHLASGAVGAMARTFKGSKPSKLTSGLNIGGLRNSALGSAVLGGSVRKPQGNSVGAKDAVNKTPAGSNHNPIENTADTSEGNLNPNAKEMPGNPQAAKKVSESSEGSDKSGYIEDLLDYLDGENGDGNSYTSDDVKNHPFDAKPEEEKPLKNGYVHHTHIGRDIGNVPKSKTEGYELNPSMENEKFDGGNYEEDNVKRPQSSVESGEEGSSKDAAKGYESNPIVHPEKFNGLNTLKPISDKNGNVNMNNLKAASSRHLLYGSMLNDNLKKFAANKPVSAKILGGVSRAANHSNEVMANRVIAGKAINATVDQMQSLAGGSEKLSREDALSELFGKSNTNKNIRNFKSALAKGDTGRASEIIASTNPINGLSLKQQSAVIAKTSPYTNIDGFRW